MISFCVTPSSSLLAPVSLSLLLVLRSCFLVPSGHVHTLAGTFPVPRSPACRPCSRQLRRRRFYCSLLLKLPARAAVKQMNNINNCKSTHTHHTHTLTHCGTLTCNHTRMQSEVNRSVCCILKGAARATKSLLSLSLDSTRAFVCAEARLMSAAHRKQFKVSCQCKFPQLSKQTSPAIE